jgi:hypothetical protein
VGKKQGKPGQPLVGPVLRQPFYVGANQRRKVKTMRLLSSCIFDRDERLGTGLLYSKRKGDYA